MSVAGLARRYPPSAPLRDSTNPPCFRLARISSRNFCGICWRLAMSAIFTGSVGGRVARSKMALSAYSLLTEMFMYGAVLSVYRHENLVHFSRKLIVKRNHG